MRWTSFSLIAGFLLATNVLVNASVDISSLPQSSQFTDLPAAARELLNNQINPAAFSRLPQSAQYEASRRLEGALAEARSTAYNQSPIANGAIPTGNSSSVPIPNTSQRSSNTISTPTTTSPSQGTIDPLGSSLAYINTNGEQSALADYTTLRLANQKELQLWKRYNDEMYDQIKLLDRSYAQLKTTVNIFKSRLQEAMLDKLPATIPNCVKPS